VAARCLQPHLDDFLGALGAAGYSFLSIGNYCQSVAHFGLWIDRNHVAIEEVDEKVVTAFATHRCRCLGIPHRKRLSRRYVERVRRFIRDLDRKGVIDYRSVNINAADSYPDFVAVFRDSLADDHGLSHRTVDRYVRLVTQLLLVLGNDPATYDAGTIRGAVAGLSPRYSRSTIQGYTTALRAYLRFLVARGLCCASLVDVVPTVPQWKLSALPRYIDADELTRVFDACDPQTTGGIRDRSILLLLGRIGLRAGDVVRMRLEDIDWADGTLRVCGKGRREVRLPLPQDVGDALLQYIAHARPAVAIDHVFLCLPAPYRPFHSSVAISGIVDAALTRAGIADPPSRGANLLRHSAATTLLRQGTTLDAVSTMLRHRSLDTSMHYAKVDTVMLRSVTQPWPEGGPC
jgi:site-specific recombinase XerD